MFIINKKRKKGMLRLLRQAFFLSAKSCMQMCQPRFFKRMPKDLREEKESGGLKKKGSGTTAYKLGLSGATSTCCLCRDSLPVIDLFE
jgi:hypothetical protein